MSDEHLDRPPDLPSMGPRITTVCWRGQHTFCGLSGCECPCHKPETPEAAPKDGP